MECASCRASLPEQARFCLHCGAALPRTGEVADPLRVALAAALGKQYEIARLLGRGGMGSVYLAVEAALEREVAIKVLPPIAAPPRRAASAFGARRARRRGSRIRTSCRSTPSATSTARSTS